MPQNVAAYNGSGSYVEVSDYIFSTQGFSNITYPAAVNQPFPQQFPSDGFARLTFGLSSKISAPGTFAILALTVTQPNGEQKTVRTDVIQAGGATAASAVVAVKAGSQLYISFESSEGNANLIDDLAYALVIEVVM